MSDPRILGLTLMAISSATFLGTTSGSLPPASFFPALGLFLIGAFVFLRANHEAMANAEQRAHRAVNPVIRQNQPAQAHAERQAIRQEAGPSSAGATETDQAEPPTADSAHPPEAIAIEDGDAELAVTSDVSLPVEVQKGDALADQLLKLNRMLEQGALTEEEYAVAKAKILS